MKNHVGKSVLRSAVNKKESGIAVCMEVKRRGGRKKMFAQTTTCRQTSICGSSDIPPPEQPYASRLYFSSRRCGARAHSCVQSCGSIEASNSTN